MSKLFLILFSFLLISCQVEKKAGGDDYIADHRSANNSFTIKSTQSGTFKTGDVLSFTLSFPSNVFVTGNPRLRLEIGSTTRYANFTGGNESKNLLFKYTIQATDNDNNGIRFLGIDLNGGQLKFYFKETLTDCSTTINEVHYQSILVDNKAPAIKAITHSNLPGHYYWKDELTFTVQYDEKVFVTGSPAPTLRLNFNTGGWKEAQYQGGSGTQNLTFKYTIENTIIDTNGITWNAAPLLLNGATIKDANGNVATNTLPADVAATNTLQINGQIPRLIDVILPANGTYKVSEHLDFEVVFDRAVSLNSGVATPYLSLTVGTQTKQASYLEGVDTDTLTFRYTPLPGDKDLDGIVLSNTIVNPTAIQAGSVHMNTFSVNNNLKNKNTSGILVDAILPSITRITRGSDTTKNVQNNYDNVWIIGQPLIITVEFNTKIDVNIQNGAPTLTIDIGGTPKVATYLTGGEGSNTMSFTYTIQENDKSTGTSVGVTSLQLNNAVVVDESGTLADLTIPVAYTTLANTTVDGERPTILSFTRPVDGYYRRSHPDGASMQRLDMSLTFSEPVNIPSSAVGIDIQLTTGIVKAGFTGTNNTNVINFRYSIPNTSAQDLDGVSIQSPLNVGTYIIRDVAGNAITDITFPTEATPNVIIDHTAPKVSSVAAPSSGLYVLGNTLNFNLTFDETVTINSAGGYPKIPIGNMTPNTRYLTPNFTGSQTGTIFTFSYTIQEDDLATTGISLGNIETSGTATIQDLAKNVFTNTALTFSETIRIDAVEVKVTSVTGPSAGIYQPNDELVITLGFSEDVEVTGSPRIRFTEGAINYDFTYSPGDSSGDTVVFKHTITNQTLRWDGIGSASSISLNGGSIQDENGIDATLSFSTLELDDIKILPSKMLAWANGSMTDIISQTTTPFFGALALTGTNSFGTNLTNVRRFITRLSFLSTTTGTILGDVDYNLVGNNLVLTDTNSRIQSVRVNNRPSPVSRVGNDFNLEIDLGESFVLEIEFSSIFAGGTLFGTSFEGQITSILLLSSSLSESERNDILSILD